MASGSPGGPARIVRWDGSEVIPIAGISTTHNTWRTDPAWWCASSGRYMVRIAADGRDFVQRLGAHNSRLDKSTYSAEAHPEMSADGTKVGYASNMLHDIEFYSMVIPNRRAAQDHCPARRRPPRDLVGVGTVRKGGRGLPHLPQRRLR